MAKADTRATAHYLTPYDSHALVNLQPTTMGPQVRLPDNSTMDPQQVVHLPLSIPPDVTETHVFSESQNASLISIGQLCDDGCQAIFNKNHFKSWILTK